MNKDRRIGLLEQFEIACIRPKKYNKLLANESSRRWLYMLTLAIFLVVIESVIPFLAWDLSVGGIKNFVTKRLPAFEITSEGMKITDDIEVNVAGVIKIAVDADKEQYTKNDIDEEYPSQILVSKTNALFVNLNTYREAKFSTMGNRTLNNNTLVSFIPVLKVGLAVYLVSLLITKVIGYLFWTLCYAAFCKTIVRTTKGQTVTMSQAFEISFYARTLCAVISSINVCLGGYINGTFMMIGSICLTMTYIRLGEMSVLSDGVLESENE